MTAVRILCGLLALGAIGYGVLSVMAAGMSDSMSAKLPAATLIACAVLAVLGFWGAFGP